MQKCSFILWIYINLFNISVKTSSFTQCIKIICNSCKYICKINCKNICKDKEEQAKVIYLLLIFTVIFCIANFVSNIVYVTNIDPPTISTSLSFIKNITTPLQYANNPLGCYSSNLVETTNGISCCTNPIEYPPLSTFYCSSPSACGNIINNGCNSVNGSFFVTCSDCVAPTPNNLCITTIGDSYPSALYCCNHVPVNCNDISNCYSVQTPNECNGFTANNLISCCCNNQFQQMPSPTYCCDSNICNSNCQLSSGNCAGLSFSNLCCSNGVIPIVNASINNYTWFNNYSLPFIVILALCINLCKYITVFSILMNRNQQYHESLLLKKYFKTIVGISICCQTFWIFYNIVMNIYFFENNIIWLFVTHLIENILNLIRFIFFLLFICAEPKNTYNCSF